MSSSNKFESMDYNKFKLLPIYFNTWSIYCKRMTEGDGMRCIERKMSEASN